MTAKHKAEPLATRGISSQSEVTTPAGKLVGTVIDGICRYYGVPYAAPPVGALRFAAPTPVKAWRETRDATQRGPSAPQKVTPFPGIDVGPIVGPGWVRGDDYLTANIWTPDGASSQPVLVYIHGGGLVLGSKDAPVYDGSAFARSGVVTVAINYRLGIEGFLPIPGAPTNIGLRDVIAALHWIQDTIAVFGGDPGKVTVCGESGGGILVSALLASPLTNGLFKRAIVMSGHGSSVVAPTTARRVVTKLAHLLRITPDVAGFRSADVEACVAATARIMRPGAVDLRDENGFDPGFGQGRFSPIFGDDVLPVRPLDLLHRGAGSDVDLLIGTTSQEANIFTVPMRLDRLLPSFAARWLLGRAIPNATAVLRAYGLGDQRRRAGEVLSEVLTDAAFTWPARQFAAAHQGTTHVYEFDWQSDGVLPHFHGRFGKG